MATVRATDRISNKCCIFTNCIKLTLWQKGIFPINPFTTLQLYWNVLGKIKYKHENGLDYPHVESSNVTWNGVNCAHENLSISSIGHVSYLTQYDYQEDHYMMIIWNGPCPTYMFCKLSFQKGSHPLNHEVYWQKSTLSYSIQVR